MHCPEVLLLLPTAGRKQRSSAANSGFASYTGKVWGKREEEEIFGRGKPLNPEPGALNFAGLLKLQPSRSEAREMFTKSAAKLQQATAFLVGIALWKCVSLGWNIALACLAKCGRWKVLSTQISRAFSRTVNARRGLTPFSQGRPSTTLNQKWMYSRRSFSLFAYFSFSLLFFFSFFFLGMR